MCVRIVLLMSLVCSLFFHLMFVVSGKHSLCVCFLRSPFGLCSFTNSVLCSFIVRGNWPMFVVSTSMCPVRLSNLTD